MSLRVKLSLQAKLLLMMTGLAVALMGAMTYLNIQSEKMLLNAVNRQAEQLVKAMEVSVERLTTQGATDEARLGEYMKRLNKKGIKEVSIISHNEEIIASTDPSKVGSKSDIGKKRKDLLIRAVLGEESRKDDQAYNLIVPIVVGKEERGYIHLTMHLDEFRDAVRYSYIKRIALAGIILLAGMVAAVFISRRYIRPIDEVIAASGMVASGNLDHRLPEDRTDEIGELTRSFNRMTERLRESRELEERLRKAERLSAMGQLSSGIAHEIRNPLNLISLTVDYIGRLLGKGEKGDREEIERRLGIVKDELKRLNTLVEGFLNFGKMRKPELKAASLRTLMDEVAALAASGIKDRDLSMETQAAEEIPLLMLDRELMKSCILNIVLNAIQAIPSGGTISMSAGLAANGSEVSLLIRDSGQGIPPDILGKVFEPYFTTKEAGLGLGLSLARNIVEGHGGSIKLESVEGAGTTVEIKLPIEQKVENEGQHTGS